MKSNTMSHAERELDILIKTTPTAIIRHFVPEIIALCEAFGKSGQSGGSAPYTAGAISQAVKKLCMHETIAPLTGEDSEWNDTGVSLNRGEPNGHFQNNRRSAVFKDGKGGQAYFGTAIVWQGEDEHDSFTGGVEELHSRQYIKSFPFSPKTFRINVKKEYAIGKPEDDKMYYEEDRTDGSKHYYKYIIKDRKQLDEVFEYYDKK